MNRITSVLTYVIIVLAFAGLFVGAFWYMYPYNVITFNGDFVVKQPMVRQGGYLEYTSSYCKHMDITAIITRSFVDGIVYTTPSSTTNRDAGCHTMGVGINVPEGLPPGEYHIEILFEYRVNPIRTIVYKNNTKKFVVLE